MQRRPACSLSCWGERFDKEEETDVDVEGLAVVEDKVEEEEEVEMVAGLEGVAGVSLLVVTVFVVVA